MDDTISRQAAIDALFDWEITYDWDDHCREEDPKPAYIVSPSNIIEHLPTVEPEQKTGRWIQDESGDYKCSECGGREDRFIYGREIWYGNGESNFCPNCGIRMVGENE